MTTNAVAADATSPVKVTKSTKAASTKAATKAVKKVTVAKPAATKGVFTSVDLAAEKGINAKTLRARIRRNLAKWEPLFAGEKHTFKDNATTRKAIDALLAADA